MYRDTYRRGLEAIDAVAQREHGDAFAQLRPELQDTILKRVESNAIDSDPPWPQGFFGVLRQHTIEGMFCNPSWGGNADEIGWRLLGYPGPKPHWTAEEQQIEVDGPAR
jgi:gluconate 2-dehydrogenase gamma chain